MNKTRDVQVPLQGYLAHKKLQPPLGPLCDPRQSPNVVSYEEAVS